MANFYGSAIGFGGGGTLPPFDVTGGDTETTYNSGGNTYSLHKFTTTASATFTRDTTGVDILLIGGGGSGSNGGGGGGGLLYLTNQTITAGDYTVTVGTGGVNGMNHTSYHGEPSMFAGNTAFGGGGGSLAGSSATGGAIGSAGGCAWNVCGSHLDNSSQGNAGGTGTAPGCYPVGGGGGAGAVGGSAAGCQTGHGGAGASNSITNAPVTYAGGGGGAGICQCSTQGNGSTGGGGGGAKCTATATNGTDELGGGGGGSQGTTGSGGDGIVYFRYVEANQ